MYLNVYIFKYFYIRIKQRMYYSRTISKIHVRRRFDRSEMYNSIFLHDCGGSV